MATFHVIQISDMHLSRTHPFFVHNWEVVLEQLNTATPDLVIATGDLTLNGVNDFEYVRQQLDRIQAPVFAVPGNRDVGNNLPNMRDDYSFNTERREHYRRYFGEDYWSIDRGEWRLVGLNALIFGSQLACEAEQTQWLQSTLRKADRRPVAMFFHKPLYIRSPKEQGQTQTCVTPEPREALLKIITSHDIRLLATGHLHQYRTGRFGHTRLVWAPATAYIVNDPKRGRFGGRRRVGYLEYRFQEREFRCMLREPPDLINHDLSGWFRDGIEVAKRNIEGVYRGLP